MWEGSIITFILDGNYIENCSELLAAEKEGSQICVSLNRNCIVLI